MASRQTIEIKVQDRKIGKGASRNSRQKKMIPGILYGPKFENTPVLIDELTVSRFSGHGFESTIFKLQSETAGLNSLQVLIKSVQKNPSTHRPIHVDLYALDMGAVIRVPVELRLVGEPVGVKSEGGLLTQVLREIEIECRPSEIPDAISVDVSGLGLGESIHVSELSLGDGVKAITAGERTIAVVNSPAADEPATSGADAAAAATAAPAAGKAAPAAGKAAPAAAKADAKPAAGKK